MEHISLLKDEKDNIYCKFNKIKKWLLSNIYINVIYIYENEVDVKYYYKQNNILISQNVFPFLYSTSIESEIDTKKDFLIESNNHYIAYLLKNENVQKIKQKYHHKLHHFDEKNINYKLWYYIEDNEIGSFLHFFEKYISWKQLNIIKLAISYRFPEIINYDGKNKIQAKNLGKELKINVPKTFQILHNRNEITDELLKKYPNCIIKPSNLDNGRLVFKQTKNKPLNSDFLKNNFIDFDKIHQYKELMPLIKKTNMPKIIIEQYIEDMNGRLSDPCEFKFYVFNGKIAFFLAIKNHFELDCYDFFDENFNKIPNYVLSLRTYETNYNWPKLHYFEQLKSDVLKIYEKFKKDIGNTFVNGFIRIDFFITRRKYYFSEFSLFPNEGYGKNLTDYGCFFFLQKWLPEVVETLEIKVEKPSPEKITAKPLSFSLFKIST